MVAHIHFHKSAQAHSPNVYRLIGKNEDALTFALGHLMAIDEGFMLDVLKKVGVLESVQGRRYRDLRSDYKVFLQERRDVGANGRRDVVLEAGGEKGLRVVIEAKIGRGQPDACQLLRYTIGCDCPNHPHERPQGWGGRSGGFVVALTRDPMDPGVKREIEDKLRGSGIELRSAQWHQILEVVLNRQRQVRGHLWQSVFLSEFANFFRGHYEMKFYDAEVMVQDEDPANAPIYLDDYMYVGGSRVCRAPLYFAPYFTQACINHKSLPKGTSNGISHISKVEAVQTISLRDLLANPTAAASPELQRHVLWERWRRGLDHIRQRADREEWKDDSVWLYFLSEPAPLGRTVRKRKGHARLAPGFRTTFLSLLTKDDLEVKP